MVVVVGVGRGRFGIDGGGVGWLVVVVVGIGDCVC